MQRNRSLPIVLLLPLVLLHQPARMHAATAGDGAGKVLRNAAIASGAARDTH